MPATSLATSAARKALAGFGRQRQPYHRPVGTCRLLASFSSGFLPPSTSTMSTTATVKNYNDNYKAYYNIPNQNKSGRVGVHMNIIGATAGIVSFAVVTTSSFNSKSLQLLMAPY